MPRVSRRSPRTLAERARIRRQLERELRMRLEEGAVDQPVQNNQPTGQPNNAGDVQQGEQPNNANEVRQGEQPNNAHDDDERVALMLMRARNERFQSCVSEFECKMRELDLDVCLSCCARKRKSDISRRDRFCSKCRRSGNNQFTVENMMGFGEVPLELSRLTLIEQVLIARVHPLVSVFKIMGRQRAYSGHVINFVQRVEQVATRLPHRPREVNSIVLFNRETANGLIQFQVRSRIVRAALIWLRANNRYYSDIIIDEAVLRELPEDGNVAHELPEMPPDDDDNAASSGASTATADEGPNVASLDPYADVASNQSGDCGDGIVRLHGALVPDLPALNDHNAIDRNIRSIAENEGVDIADWPDLDENPLNEFNEEGIVCKAFPVLFPFGIGDLNAPRVYKITGRDYFKYLMRYRDGRFANDDRFPYYAYNSLARWDALNCGHVYVRNHMMQNMNAAYLMEMLNNRNTDIAASIMYYGTRLRGTRAYWKQRCSELLQMVRQLGMPTVFFTLSAADYHWPDLFRILTDIHGIDPVTLTDRMRQELMHDNPYIVSWFFEQRCDLFMRHFLMKFFPIKDYWFRYEWQFRGSPHVHGLLWLEDAPNCDNVSSLTPEQRDSIATYFDTIVQATIGTRYESFPDGNPCRRRYTDLNEAQKETDLDKLLSSVQRHTRHGAHCLTKRRGVSRRFQCRFGFPISESATSILQLDEGYWKFFPRRNDTYIQRYNKFVTQAWRGNTDFSAVTSPEAVLKYIAKYATKGEHASESYSEILRRIMNRNRPDSTAITLIRQLLISSLAERNYSAQEVMHLLMGYPLYHASRTFIVIGLDDEWRRYGMNNNSTMQQYSARGPELRNLSLYEYAKGYYRRSGADVARQKHCIVRAFPVVKLTEDPVENERYYRLQCKLHIPWRTSVESLLPQGATWQEYYVAHLGNIERAEVVAEEFPVPDEVEFEELPENQDHVVRDAGMVAARLRPTNQPRDLLGHRPIDEAFTWSNLASNPNNLTSNTIDSYLRAYKRHPIRRTFQDQAITESQLSTEQRRVLSICRQQLNDPNHDFRRVLVQGKAGTGKSAVIKALCHLIDQHFQPRRNVAGNQEDSNDAQEPLRAYQVLAPTGAAADNVDGKTLHSFLRIPAQGPLVALDGQALRSFRLQFRLIRFIIVDEYSMIGLRFFHKIHSRLCEASGDSSKPFGGYFIYFFGDLRQLPPVMDTAIYMTPRDDYSRYSVGLIREFQARIILTVTHRQGPDQIQFKQTLDSLAMGSITQAGWELLMQRRRSLQPNNLELFSEAIHLYPTNDSVRTFNLERLGDLRRPVAQINAWNNTATAANGSENQAQGLANVLFLSIDCRVILRKNICVERGLVNGSLGTVRDIIFKIDEGPPLLPFAILIEFDKFTGPHIVNRCFSLKPATSTWKEGSVECVRKQYPIALAYALTIHKSQGLTLDRAAVEIGPRETSVGITYVALSRVRRLDDLLLLSGCDYPRLAGIGRMQQVINRERFLVEFFAHDLSDRIQDQIDGEESADEFEFQEN